MQAFSSCSATCRIWAPLLGIEPVSPALASGFLTIRPPEKSLAIIFWCSWPSALCRKTSMYSSSSSYLRAIWDAIPQAAVLSSVQSLSRVRFFVTPWTQHTRLPCPSPTPGVCSNTYPSSRRCHWIISSSVVPFSSCLQSFPASGSFQWVSSSHQVAKLLAFQLQHQSFQFRTSNSGLISFKIDWFDLLAVQGTLKSFLQHHSSRASNLRCSSSFMVQVLVLPQIKLNLQVPLYANFLDRNFDSPSISPITCWTAAGKLHYRFKA